MHGFFSLGTVVGAVTGMFLTAIALPVTIHLPVLAGVVLLGLFLVIGALSPDVGRHAPSADTAMHEREPRSSLWKDGRLLLIGLITLGLAMAEGSANDWLPLIMVDGHGLDPTLGSAVYAAFAAAMTAGRFVGGRFVDRFGRAAVLAVSAVIGATGVAVVILLDNQGDSGLRSGAVGARSLARLPRSLVCRGRLR